MAPPKDTTEQAAGLGASGGPPASHSDVVAGDAAGAEAARAVGAGGMSGDGDATATQEAPPAAGGAESTVEQAKQDARERAEQAKVDAMSAADTAKARASETKQSAQQAAAGAAQSAQAAAGQVDRTLDQRPEIIAGAAFAGGFVLAKVIGALGGDDE